MTDDAGIFSGLKVIDAANFVAAPAAATILADFGAQHLVHAGKRLVIGKVDRLLARIGFEGVAQIVFDHVSPLEQVR